MGSEKEFNVSERPVSSEPDLEIEQEKIRHHSDAQARLESGSPTNEQDAQWRPGFIARFPWLGLGCLLAVLLCGIGCLVTLVLADGVAKHHWGNLAPNVIVNMLNSVANLCFGIAITNGIAIAWWRKTLAGATIKQLNRSWKFSSSIKDVVLGAKYFNFIALAALAAKLTIIDGTLLQKAFSQEILPLDLGPNNTVTGYANMTIPNTGRISGVEGESGLLAKNFNDALKIWFQGGGQLPNAYNGCEGTCYLRVPGAGFEFDCSEPEQVSLNAGSQTFDAYTSLKNITQGFNVTDFDDLDCSALGNGTSACEQVVSVRTAPLFHVGFLPVFSGANLSADAWSYIQMTVNFTAANDEPNVNVSCPGTKFSQTCVLRPAVIEYPVKIQNASSLITGMSLAVDGRHYNNQTFRNFNSTLRQQNGCSVQSYADVFENPLGGERTRLGGIAQGLQAYLGGDSIMHYGAQGYHLEQSGNAATYLSNDLGVQTGGLANSANLCGFQYADPMLPTDFGGWAAKDPSHRFDVPALVGKINQIMFALALDISDEDDDKDVAAGTLVRPAWVYQDAIHYKTNFKFMWGALASMLFCIFCVLPVYYGYWQLGRPVTLGPFEIAAAFRAPVLHHPSNAAIDTLIKEVGGRRVRFGEVLDGDDKGKMAVAQTDVVASLKGDGTAARSSWRLSSHGRKSPGGRSTTG
ncbi:hypothetical protein VTL71DRAFT_6269 [Oculimacula yallundae]|uniref:Uncharacterized protein n=1 Tax=Oculimacula yallundae TaxID=86028 RepID=A0ABR4BZ52_9HELO